MDRNKKDEYSAALIAFMISAVLLAVIPYFAMGLVLVVPIVVPMLLIWAIVKSGYAVGGAAALASFAAVCFIDARFYGLLALMLLPFIFAAAYALRSKKRLLHSVMISSAAALAGVVFAIGILQAITEMGIVDYTVDRLGQILPAYDDVTISYIYQMARAADLVSGAVTFDAVLATPTDTAIALIQDWVKDWLNLSLVLMLIIYAMSMGLGVYLIARSFTKKHGVAVADIPRFADFTLPRRFWLAAVVTTLAAMVGEDFGWPSFDLLSFTLLNAYAFVFSIQALSLLDFFYVSRNMGKGVRVLLHILALLIFGGLLMWAGLFENAFGIRKRLKERWSRE